MGFNSGFTGLIIKILLLTGFLPLKVIIFFPLVDIFSLYYNLEMHARAKVTSPFGLVVFHKWHIQYSVH